MNYMLYKNYIVYMIYMLYMNYIIHIVYMMYNDLLRTGVWLECKWADSI